jgi:hypothetical protein
VSLLSFPTRFLDVEASNSDSVSSWIVRRGSDQQRFDLAGSQALGYETSTAHDLISTTPLDDNTTCQPDEGRVTITQIGNMLRRHEGRFHAHVEYI